MCTSRIPINYTMVPDTPPTPGQEVLVKVRRIDADLTLPCCVEQRMKEISAVCCAQGALDTTHWLEPMPPGSRTTD